MVLQFDDDLEEEYLEDFHRRQVSKDVLVSLWGSTVLLATAFQARGTKAVPTALAIAFLNSFPLLMLCFARRSYHSARTQILATVVIFAWYLDFIVFSAITKHLSAHGPQALPVRLQRWAGLLPPRVLFMLFSNMAQRLPITAHCLAHGVGLIVELQSTVERCRWAPQPWLGGILTSLLRRLAPPPVGSFAASELGTCTVGMRLLQSTVGFLLPIYFTYLIELRSRRSFLRRHLLRLGLPSGEVEQRISHLRPKQQLGWGLVWNATLAVLLCWQLAERAAMLNGGTP